MKKTFRQNCAEHAGTFFLAGNIRLTGLGVIDALRAGDDLTWDTLYTDPLSAVIGVTFITSSGLMSAKGGNNKAFGIAMGLGALGDGLLTYDYIQKSYPISSIAGAVVAMGITAYTAYKSYIGYQAPEEKPKVNQFQESLNSIVEKYPNAIFGLTNFSTNMAMLVGALQKQDIPMACIAGAWGIGSLFAGYSFPADDKPKLA